MAIQIYHIHLLNGEVIEAREEYDLPWKEGLIAKYQQAKEDDMFEIGDALLGFSYILKKSILYISTAGVKKVTN
jgi:hypothetical protein